MAENIFLPNVETNAQKFGTQFGTGLGAGLSNLIQMKSQQLQTRHGLQAAGFTPEQASGLSQLPQELLAPIVKQRIQQPGLQSYSRQLEKVLGGNAPAGEGQGLNASQEQAMDALDNANMTEKQHNKLAELKLKKQEIARKTKSEAFKESKELRKEIYESTKAAKSSLQDLDRLEELETEGRIDTPGFVEGMKNAGWDIPALMQEGTQEYNKIVGNFIKNAKSIFGSRISNFELEQFMKILPSLSQSPEGRKRVIANLKYVQRAQLAYNKAYKEVLSENAGVPPLDLAEQIDDKIDSKLDQVSKKFKEDLARPVPAGQSKFMTALQAGAGSVVPKLGKGLLKAAGPIGQAVAGALE